LFVTPAKGATNITRGMKSAKPLGRFGRLAQHRAEGQRFERRVRLDGLI
jgi:hypothetical protein